MTGPVIVRGFLTPEFNDEFNQVINQLREDGGFLKSRAAVSAYCYRQIDSAIDLSDQDFAFRADTKDYPYLLRLKPQKGMYTVYCYCYKREFLDHHLHQAEKRDSLYHIGLYGALSPARWR